MDVKLSEVELSAVCLLKLTSFIFWSILYLYWAIYSNRSPEWCSRIVTLLHGSVASFIGLAQCGINTFAAYAFTSKLTWCQYALMFWSWGYFMFDLLWCLLYWTNSYTMIFHHISAIVAINFYLGRDYTGCTFACTIALLEITNPLLQTRWLLRDAGYKNTILYYVVEVTYLSLFMILRGLLGSYLLFHILWSETFCLYEKFISLSLYIISMVFIYEIIGYVLYRYKNKIEEFTGFINEVEAI